jgi:hypothetical protein
MKNGSERFLLREGEKRGIEEKNEKKTEKMDARAV